MPEAFAATVVSIMEAESGASYVPLDEQNQEAGAS